MCSLRLNMNNKGVVMLIVIGFVFMLLILGATLMLISASHFGTSYHQVARTKAYYAAEAVMQHVFWKCRFGSPPGYGLSPTFPAPGQEPVESTSEVFDGETINGIDASDIDIEIYALGDHLSGVHWVRVTAEY